MPADAFDVPVFVRHSSPLTPESRPRPSRVTGAWRPWPTVGEIPPPGDYLVTTTWRDVIDAAMSVGRGPIAWLAAVPMLAWAEIVARRSPLFAYLERTSVPGGPGSFLVRPNVVYRQGTESTMQTAFGYRAGMTMAEWPVDPCWEQGQRRTPRASRLRAPVISHQQ